MIVTNEEFSILQIGANFFKQIKFLKVVLTSQIGSNSSE